MRRIARTKKIGHLGTLDPIATGVLPLVIGRATRLAQFYTRSDKIYEGVVRFGWATTTYDRAGEPAGPRSTRHRRRDPRPRPSPLSADRSSRRRRPSRQRRWRPAGVRAGAEVGGGGAGAGPGRGLRDSSVLEAAGPEARLRVHCSGGTYMRSIAHDLGQALGCGAHLTELRRLASGEFELARRGPSRNWRLWPPRSGCSTRWCLFGAAAGLADRVGGRADRHADPQRPKLPGVAFPFGGGLASGEGGFPGRASWWRSGRPSCRTCTIRRWSFSW